MGTNVDVNTAASVKDAQELVKRAYESQKILAEFDQPKIDRIVESMVRVGYEKSRKLAMMAVEETGIGVVEDKVLKNQFATKGLQEYIKDMRTAGIISEDRIRGVVEIAAPMGVVVGIVPTTNPTSTVMFKAIISVKARNSIVFSPHPRAIKCSMEAARLMEEAAVAAGAPKGLVNCLSLCTREASDELMHNDQTAIILATGGAAMVKSAYSSGKPAYGVGPGNVPAFIERSADIAAAVERIFASKTFDNGTICASEQSIIAEKIISESVIAEIKKQGGYFATGAELEALEKTVIQPQGGVNPKVVGKSPGVIAELAGIKIPEGTRVILGRQNGVGSKFPLSAEKLCPVLAFYEVNDWKSGCELCFELLKFGGLGHTLSIHSRNEEVIKEFALKKPVFRILVNTPSSQGAVGITTALAPSLTLGCGTLGGNITSDNVSPLHLINTKRLAYHLADIKAKPESKAFDFCYTRAEIIKAVDTFVKGVK